LCAFLASCGGGETYSTNDEIDLPNIQTGIFYDSSVSGLYYECTIWQYGYTDENGTFACNEGFEVSFYIGDKFIGSALPQDGVVTPMMLFPDDDGMAVGLARVLQSLDDDRDPSNGIKLDEDKIAMISSANFEFTDEDFTDSVISAIGEPLVGAGIALMHLNQSLRELSIDTVKQTLLEQEIVDNDNDGIPDAVTGYTYDINGLQTGQTEDTDGDGVVDVIYSFAYDSDWNLKSRSLDTDGDGVADNYNVYEYDSYGRITQRKVDDDGDGEFESIIYRTYNIYGRELSRSIDNAPLGDIDSITTTNYNVYNQQESMEIDSDADGDADYSALIEYGEEGYPYKYSIDNDGDGIYEEVRIFTTDSEGNPLSMVSEDESYIVTYDRQGDSLIIKTVYDRDMDDIADETIVETINRDNLKGDHYISIVRYNGPIGSDFYSAVYYDYDADGNVSKRTYYYLDEETPMAVTTYIWGEY
jgi:hypothetical protein